MSKTTKIKIKHERVEYQCTFEDYFGNEKRLWIRQTFPFIWFATVGRYCPHKTIANWECVDCALNVE